MTGLEQLREKYPWPSACPELAEDWFGWLCNHTANMLTRNLDNNTQLVVELGSFLGVSSKAILLAAPNAHLICVDTWKGSPEHLAPDAPEAWRRRVPFLYEGFLCNMWPWRDRVTPLRADSLDGLAEIREAGLTPDLVYVDSEHTYNRVIRELRFCLSAWPKATIVGDDYNNAAVKEAADEVMRELRRTMQMNPTAFCFPRE